MPRIRGACAQRGGRRGGRRGGTSRPRCARSLSFPMSRSESGNAEAVEPTPGPSVEPTPGPSVEPTPGPSVERSRPSSMVDQLKAIKVARALDAKNVARLSPAQQRHLAMLRQNKQVGNFMMPDAPEPKKRKVARADTRVWSPCPLLPGVPSIPPPRTPQPWELQVPSSHDIAEEEEEEEVIEGTPPDFIISPSMLGRRMQSATAAESVMDATEEVFPSIEDPIPGPSKVPHSTSTPPGKKSRKTPFTPSTGIVQSAVLPGSPLLVDIELLGFTPSSTTTTAPGSGRSAYELDVEIDIERDFIEPGEGSDVDLDDCHEELVKTRTVDEYPVDCDNLEDPSLARAARSCDDEADRVLRTAVGPEHAEDLLSFDWRCEAEHFQGTREVFTVPSGPTFENAQLTPSEIFLKIWDANIIAQIVRETNKYGRHLVTRNRKPKSRLTRWKDVTDEEIRFFFPLL